MIQEFAFIDQSLPFWNDTSRKFDGEGHLGLPALPGGASIRLLHTGRFDMLRK